MNRQRSAILLLGVVSSALPLAAPRAAAQSLPSGQPTAAAQSHTTGQPPPITPADYGQWERLGRAHLSPDGEWLAYTIRRVNGKDELRVRNIERGTLLVFPYGEDPVFSPNSRWLAYAIGVGEDERERLEAEDQPVRSSAGILDLASGDTTSVAAIASFRFSGDGGYLALHGYPPESDSTTAAELLVRQLATGRTTRFGNVSEFRWSDHGALLALAVDAVPGAGNAVQLYDPESNSFRVLDSSTSLYRGLAWREDAADLAVLRSAADSVHRDTTHVVLAWRGLDGASPERSILDPASAPGVPEDMRVSEGRKPEWSEDGSSILIGLRPRVAVVEPFAAYGPGFEAREADSADGVGGEAETVAATDTAEAAGEDAKISDVQVWHARDERIFPRQREMAERDLRRTLLAVWHLDEGGVVALGTDLMDETRVLEGGRYAIETDHDPYRRAGMFGRPWDDIYLIDTGTGDRRMVLDKVRHFMGGSATGRYLLWFDGVDYWTYDIRTSDSTNITAELDSRFEDESYDYPTTIVPPYGMAGWLRGDSAVLVYDEYDVWRIQPDGSGAQRLTRGANDSVVHRLVRLEPTDSGINPGQPLYLSIEGQWTKRTGFARLEPGGDVSRRVFEDAHLGRLSRADSAEVFAFVRQDFDDSPDIFIGGPALADARRVTETNPFQADFAWGHSEVFDFRSATGRRLQAALFYPANYDPSRRYPMIVYQYEILSNRVHDYVVPSERDYYNVTVWTSQGYFVLMPDIVYRPRDPGRSAVDAVVPAVRSVIERGIVDPARVGLIGHSWGGYQAAYIPTQTDIFAAAVAGAALTNFLSMPGAIHWSGGFPEFEHWETGQARMGVPPWKDFEAHVLNSPIAFVQDLETPMLMMFGNEDGTVDWHQGIQFYNYARRAGKENFVLLVYPGEDHGLEEEANQTDYQRRILEWFGHWLKGEPAPKWITEGVSFLERKRRLESEK